MADGGASQGVRALAHSAAAGARRLPRPAALPRGFQPPPGLEPVPWLQLPFEAIELEPGPHRLGKDSTDCRDGGSVSDNERADEEQEGPSPLEHCVADEEEAADGIQQTIRWLVGWLDDHQPEANAERPLDAEEPRALHEVALKQLLDSDDDLPGSDMEVTPRLERPIAEEHAPAPPPECSVPHTRLFTRQASPATSAWRAAGRIM